MVSLVTRTLPVGSAISMDTWACFFTVNLPSLAILHGQFRLLPTEIEKGAAIEHRVTQNWKVDHLPISPSTDQTTWAIHFGQSHIESTTNQ